MRILITGGFGFIGSSLVKYLNDRGFANIDIAEPEDQYASKWRNAVDIVYNTIIDSSDLIKNNCFNYDTIIHLGANSATNQPANKENWFNNIDYSKLLISKCNNRVNTPIIIFASSASVYGNETSNFSERLDLVPINFYAYTKLNVEKYIKKLPNNNNIYCLRFFNVYGAREHHKVESSMSSPIYKWLKSTDNNHTIELLESSNPLFPTKKMARDFIYVDDVCSIIHHCMSHRGNNDGGIYNVGSGVASTWEQVANAIFKTKNISCGSLAYRKMPESLAKHYQYYTCADTNKLRNDLGYKQNFLSIEEGIELTYKEIKDLYGNV